MDRPNLFSAHPGRCRLRVGWFWGIGMLVANPAAAQQKSSAPERIEPGTFHFRRADAFIEVESTVEQFRVRSEDGTGRVNARHTNRNALTQTLLGLNFNGDVIHPYLIDFYGNLGIGLSEGRFRENSLTSTESDKATGVISEYDLRVDFLKNKPISGTVYGQRGDDRIARLFLPSLREVRNAYGTAWVWKSASTPMQLSFDHVETDRTGNRNDLDDERIVEDRLRYSGQWIISEQNKFTYDYEHGRTQQQYQGSEFDFDTQRDQLRLDHDLAFGAQDQHRLQTLLRYQEESGDLAIDLFEFGPQLTLQHTSDLSTYYKYQFTREAFDAIEVDLHRADFQIAHQFMKNLNTVVDLFGLTERTENDVETEQGGASVDWHYTRNNPFGQLSTELGLAGDVQRTRGSDGLRLVRNESGTFRDPLPLYLVRRNVKPTSIVVTDLTGRTVYRPGIDYRLTTTKDRTALYRIASGRITNGQTVLIDYRHDTPADGGIDTMRVDFGLQQAFAFGLTPYYRMNYRNQEVDVSEGFPFIADRTNQQRIGAKYDKARWGLFGEFEIFDDAIEPYDAFHVGGNVQAIRSPTQTLSLRSEFSQYFFEGGFDERDVSEVNLSANHEYRINERWTTSAASTYRWEDDSVRGITNGIDLEGGLAYHRGTLTVEMTLEYNLLRVAGSREDGVAGWLQMRWDFLDLLPKQ